MTTITKLKAALDALEAEQPWHAMEDLRSVIAEMEAEEPYAYAVYFPDQPTIELVHDLDDLIDDMTNREHEVTNLYPQPQLKAKQFDHTELLKQALDALDELCYANTSKGEAMATAAIAAIKEVLK